MNIRNTLRRRLGRGSAWEPGLVLDAPAPSPGESIAPPDFVGVGAQKAGTTWWFSLLLTHPGVRGPAGERKELHFFNRFVLADPKAHLDRYASWFPRRAGQIAGEFTPAYMAQPWTPPLIRRAAPDARILVLLRDPLQRLVSGLTHEASRGHLLTPTVVSDAIQRSRYDWQIEALLATFPADRVLVLQYEACKANAQREFDRTLAFLGLPPHTLSAPGARANETTTAKVAMLDEVVSAIRPALAASARRTAELVPGIDLSRWETVQ